MQAAIRAARIGLRKGHGGPFGACITQGDQIIAVAHNTVLWRHDPTAHAEINAIRLACRRLKTHILTGCSLYATAEPCPMCLGAIYWSGIRVVFSGVTLKKTASFGFNDAWIMTELKRPISKRRLKFHQGVLAAACLELFYEWRERKGILY